MGVDSEKILCPVHRWAILAPERVAVDDGSMVITYAELNNLIESVADRLLLNSAADSSLSLGLVVGPSPSLETMVTVLAVLRLGGRVALFNERVGTDILEIQTKIADVQLLRGPFDILNPKTLRSTQSVRSEWAPSATLVIFTSGSQGVPRGVIHSSRTLATHLEASTAALHLGAEDCWLVSLPCFHVGGLLISLRMWWCGGRCIFPVDLQRSTLVKTLKTYPSISHISLIPQMIEELVCLPEGVELLRKCKVVLLGGAPLSSLMRRKLLDLQLPVWVGYGSSEFCSHIALGPLSRTEGGAGFPIAGARICFDPDGRIGAYFPALFAGYCGETEREPNSIYWTSDCGEFSSDNELIVLGRIDRVIISGGEKIDPLYIEEVVMTQLSALGRGHRCVVLGFPHPKWGERPVLFVEHQRVSDTLPDWSDWEIEIQACIKEIIDSHLPGLLRPEIIIAVPHFPVTGPGKVAIGTLRSDYLRKIKELLNG